MSHSVTSPYVSGMKNRTRKPSALVILAAALALALMGAGTLPASAQGCLSNREIQEAISSGQVISPYEAVERAGYASSDVLDFQLCDQGGRLVYIIQVLSPSGEAQNLVLDAQ